MKYLPLLLMLFSVSANCQTTYPPVHTYDEGITPLGEVWAYVQRVDKTLDSAMKMIDSLKRELKTQKELLQFNTDMGNYYIRQVDSFRQHGIGVYKSYKIKDTLSLGPFYIY